MRDRLRPDSNAIRTKGRNEGEFRATDGASVVPLHRNAVWNDQRTCRLCAVLLELHN